ncbi:MAG: cadherin-like beta sandwich domain-containing protein [Lachnospiraceae bacterium]|nr:cadherin-like beta sandwich domain-containing protein [Lachnospiraceae bacterium]
MRKIGKLLTGVALCAAMLFGRALPVAAADGVLQLSVSSESIKQGESLTVDVAAKTADGKEAVSIMRITYDASIFSFVSCSETCGAGSGLVSVTTNQATITLKAIGSGESTIEVTGEDGVAYDTAEELSKMTGAKKTVTVNPAVSESAKKGLSSLAVSEGSLTPAFTPATKEYATAVPYETTSVAVNAKTADSSATVQSLSGNTNLSVGDNPVTVTVKADNGATETYTIHVVRAEEGQSVAEAQNIALTALEGTGGQDTGTTAAAAQQAAEHPEEVMLDGVTYRISDVLPADFAEADFVTDAISYQGKSFPALRFEKNSDIYLVSMKAEDGTEGMYVYNRITGQFSPYVKLQNGDHYIIVLAPPTFAELPAGYVSLTLDLDGMGGVTAYQKLSDPAEEKPGTPDVTDEEFDPSAVGMLFQEIFGVTEVYAADRSDFYLMYAVNNDGKEDWYQYDLGEDTYQRYAGVTEELVVAEAPVDTAVEAAGSTEIETLKKEFEEFRKLALYILIGIGAGFLLLLILLIVFGVQLRKAKEYGSLSPEDEEEEKSLWEELEEQKEPEEDDAAFADDLIEEIEEAPEDEYPEEPEEEYPEEEPEEDLPEEPVEEPEDLPEEKPEKHKKHEKKAKKEKEKPEEKSGEDSDSDLEVLDLNDL